MCVCGFYYFILVSIHPYLPVKGFANRDCELVLSFQTVCFLDSLLLLLFAFREINPFYL